MTDKFDKVLIKEEKPEIKEKKIVLEEEIEIDIDSLSLASPALNAICK